MATLYRFSVGATLAALLQSISAWAAPEPGPEDTWATEVPAPDKGPEPVPPAQPPLAPSRRPGPALPTPVSIGPSPPTATPYDGPPLLLGTRKPAIGVYAGVGTSYTHMLHRDGVVASAEVALLVDHRLSIGLGGDIFSRTPRGPLGELGQRREFFASYGGLVTRYALFLPDFPVYASLGVLLGGGAVALVDEQRIGNDHDFEDDFEDDVESGRDRGIVEPFLVAQPELFLHVNATRWLRFGAGGGYRFASGIDRFGFRAKDIGGAVLGANVQLGWL